MLNEKITADIELAKEKVKFAQKKDTLVFPIFTDLHAVKGEYDKVQKLMCVLESFTTDVQCNGVISLGDNLNLIGRWFHASNDEVKEEIKKIFDELYSRINCPILTVNGNHDALGTDFFDADFWNGIVKNKYGNTQAVYDSSGAYYYIDYEKAATRLIILSAPYGSDLEAENPTPLWEFGEKQLEWLSGTALDTDNDIIIISHVPFFYCYAGDKTTMKKVWDGEKERMSSIYALSGEIKDSAKAVRAFEEFKNKRTGRLVACLSGHTHSDSVFLPYEEKGEDANPLPCHQFVTKSTSLAGECGVAVDIAVWTPSENEFKLIRIGDGTEKIRSLKY